MFLQHNDEPLSGETVANHSDANNPSFTTTTVNHLEHNSNTNNDHNEYSGTTTATTSIPWFVVKATAIASLGGILFGYDMGVICDALPQLKGRFDLSQHDQERVVSLLYLGGGVGAAVGGSLCDFMGRRVGIIITDIIFVWGAALLFGAQSLPQLLLGRFVVGFAVSVSGIADVTYLHEIAPIEWRGSIVSVNESCISLGFLLAYLLGYVLSWTLPTNGWRTMFGLSGVIALIQLVGMCHMPESPVWLKEKGRLDEARQVLERIHGTPILVADDHDAVATTTTQEGASTVPPLENLDATPPIGNFYESIASTSNYGTQSHHHTPTTRPLVCWYVQQCFVSFRQVAVRYHRQMWIAFFLSVAQQLCGQTNVLNYAPLIFANLGLVSSKSTLGSTLLIGVVKFLVTAGVIWKIEFMGRRFLLLTGMTIVVFGLFLLTLAFMGSQDDNNNNINNGQDEYDESVPKEGSGLYLALPGVLCVVLGYSASFGPLTWLLTSELFPSEIRGRALGGSTIVTYLCASLVTATFLSAQSWLGASTVFGIYGIITVCGIVFAYLAIPDTGAKNVEEIDVALGNMWWWRNFHNKNHHNNNKPAVYMSSLMIVPPSEEESFSHRPAATVHEGELS